MTYEQFRQKYGLDNFIASDIWMSYKLWQHNSYEKAPICPIEEWLERGDTKLLIEKLTSLKSK